MLEKDIDIEKTNFDFRNKLQIDNSEKMTSFIQDRVCSLIFSADIDNEVDLKNITNLILKMKKSGYFDELDVSMIKFKLAKFNNMDNHKLKLFDQIYNTQLKVETIDKLKNKKLDSEYSLI